MGFLQIGGGLAGTLLAALLFADAFQALINVLPLLAIAGVAGYALLGGGMSRRRPEPDTRDVEIAVDPSGVIGAGGEEIEDLLHPPRTKSRRPDLGN
jgi:DHA1 family bicyclomycin/chloramphenicol resistance-like MFS transporter